MKFPSLVLIVTPLLLAGCASPRARLETGLREAGMGKKSSACMSREMSQDLSLGELIKLSKLSRFREKSVGKMTLGEFLKATRAIQDPHILKIATAAAVVCAIRD